MKTIIFLILIFITNPSFAAQKYKMYLPKTKKYQEIKFVRHDGFLISEGCIKNRKINCDAWRATKRKGKQLDRQVKALGHPAALYCHAQDAENRILIGKKNEQDDFCLFKDGSLVLSWDLYDRRKR